MSYFRTQRKNQLKSPAPSSVDGFLSPSQKKVDIRDRFEMAYVPEARKQDADTEFRTPRGSRRSEDGFLDMRDHDDSEVGAQRVYTADDYFADAPSEKGERAKKHKRRHKKGLGKKIFKGLAVAFIALILGVSSLFVYGFIKTRGIFHGDGQGAAALEKDVDPTKLAGEGDGRINILLLGKGGVGHEAPDLTDTILVASIDPVQNEAALLSIPRDLYVKDKKGNSTKINALYSNAKQGVLRSGKETDQLRESAEQAGLTAVQDSIKEVIGLPIHYYIMVDFTAFQKAIDTVGGITIDVKNPVSERMLLNGKPYNLDVKTGVQQFDSLRAFAYVRCRHCDNRSDFGRSQRQREVLIALQKKIVSAGTYSNPFKILELINAFGDHVRTDLNNLDEVKRLYEIGQAIPSTSISSVSFVDQPNVLVKTGNVDGQSIVMPTAGLYQYDEIKSYVRNTIRDAYLKKEDAKIVVLNGTKTSGLASATAKELKSFGYTVLETGDASNSEYTSTVIVDFTNGQKKYTKSYLEKRLKVTATTTAPEAGLDTKGADFVIILGKNETQ